jgi:hypothetical protein
MTTDDIHFYLQNRVIQTVQTGGRLESDTSPLVFPEYINNIYDFKKSDRQNSRQAMLVITKISSVIST